MNRPSVIYEIPALADNIKQLVNRAANSHRPVFFSLSGFAVTSSNGVFIHGGPKEWLSTEATTITAVLERALKDFITNCSDILTDEDRYIMVHRHNRSLISIRVMQRIGVMDMDNEVQHIRRIGRSRGDSHVYDYNGSLVKNVQPKTEQQ